MRLHRTLLLAGLLAATAHPSRAQAPARRPPAPPAATAPTAPPAPTRRPELYWPGDPFWSTRAPDTVLVDIETTRGPITIELRRAWAPHGV
ncbi:MAG TPA: hypothetical protein VEZ47_08065, partial [Gemmatirosa sp.]|nr:hypothetical protein [Gemmatirosa sp.]